MANIFALILTFATLITGVMWCVEKFVYRPRRRAAASQQQSPEDKKATGWFDNLASLFPVLLLVLIVRSFIYEPYQIPSGSMMPTLLVGDFILVEKFAYGMKDPVMQKTLIHTSEPKYGDIVVFKYPANPSVVYIKRVIGLPGDRVSYDPFSKEITVQPHCASHSDCDTLPIHYSDIKPYHSENYNNVPISQRTETIGDVNHRILLLPFNDSYLSYYQQPDELPETWLVPAGHYFVMGDNRDNSEDSRYWGFVPEANLIGKATFIWLSFKKREGEWPTGLRLERIGRIH